MSVRRRFVPCLVAAAALATSPLSAQQAAHDHHAPEVPPNFQVDPFWPKPLPNNWIFGQVAGVAVDRRDHIWIVHRPASLQER